MTILVIAEHDNASLKGATHHASPPPPPSAATCTCWSPARTPAPPPTPPPRSRASPRCCSPTARSSPTASPENVAAQVIAIAKDYSHVLAPATANGKNVAPRVAALLDVGQISDITKVIAADTFERPIYAGNAIATVQSTDAIKVITVRTTGFDARPPKAAAPPSNR